MHGRQAGKLTEAAAAFYRPAAATESNPFLASLAAAQKDQAFEVWPENWPAFRLFCTVQTQWRTGIAGPTGLDYTAVLALMARMELSREDHDSLFDDVQVLERSALETMSQKDG